MNREMNIVRLTASALFLGISLSLSAAPASKGGAESELTAANGWFPIADGVLEHEAEDGSVTRIAYGPGGADYERQRLLAEIADLQLTGPTTSDDVAPKIAALQKRLDAIPAKPGHGAQPLNATSSVVCGRRIYVDHHNVAGAIGDTAVTRAIFAPNPSGINLGAPASMTLVITSSVVPVSESTVTATQTITTYEKPGDAVADWVVNSYPDFPVTASSCTASSNASLSVTDSACSGGSAFQTFNVSYPSCASVP